MNPVAAWHDEHAYFLQLLEQLQRELDDRQHHPREEAAYGRLAARDPDVLPRAAASLTAQDWQAVSAAAPGSLQQ